MQTREEAFGLLVQAVSGMAGVVAIGKSGGGQLPENNESDIDVFVFCTGIPGIQSRKVAIGTLGGIVKSAGFGEREGRHWGLCDFICLDGAEICLMYFTVQGMNRELDSVLRGERLDKEDNYFYPTGRCASFESMHAFYDPNGYIASVKHRLTHYPDDLSKRLVKRHFDALMDMEDIERAVLRKDTLFYHFALDLALDHLLQLLFAMNGRFFPSRKRSVQYIRAFNIKPVDCEERLLHMVALGGEAESIEQSYGILRALRDDISELVSGGTQ